MQSNKSDTAVYRQKLTRALAASMAAWAGFGALAGLVLGGYTLEFDEQILQAIHSASNVQLDRFFSFATELGGFYAVTVIGLVLVGWLIKTNRKVSAIMVVFGVAGAGLVNVLLKLIFERPRPDLWEQIVLEGSFSFPSGHAMASSSIALSCIIVSWRTKWRMPVLFVSVVYIVLIGVSRLYLGVHYPSDVIGGWLASLGWVSLVFYLVGKFLLVRPAAAVK